MNAELLAIIDSGKPGRFDNALRPVILPKGHRFTVTCDCAECDHVWRAANEVGR
jgi:hypothetical protein